MPLLVKSHLRSLVTHTPLWNLYQPYRSRRDVNAWERSGRSTPPPHPVKQGIVSSYGAEFGIKILVETGTFRGDMVDAMKGRFEAIYSIELSPRLCALARHRFHRSPHIRILRGDSGSMLPEILAGISAPCLFWLDGHYSGGDTARGETETPVLGELRTILTHRFPEGGAQHVVLIDDARCFDGTHDYPRLDQLEQLSAALCPGREFSVDEDVIRIHSPRRKDLPPGALLSGCTEKNGMTMKLRQSSLSAVADAERAGMAAVSPVAGTATLERKVGWWRDWHESRFFVRNVRRLWRVCLFVGFDPRRCALNLAGLPRFLVDAICYSRRCSSPAFRIHWIDLFPVLDERRQAAGKTGGHYFHQDLWAARRIFSRRPATHIDIGSRIDGFIAHLLAFMPVTVIDIRPTESRIPGLTFLRDDATRLSRLGDNSVDSLSTLHAAEHFGLGRYSDPVEPDAWLSFAASLERVLRPGGRLYFSVPVGRERVDFNANRVFAVCTILRVFSQLELVSFSLVDDAGCLHEDVNPVIIPETEFGCGLFEFTKYSPSRGGD